MLIAEIELIRSINWIILTALLMILAHVLESLIVQKVI
jgi:hypothetical protein